jgi:hypothetical protein
MAEAIEHAPHLTGLTNYANPFDTWEITRYAGRIRYRNRPVLLIYGSHEEDLDIGYYPLKRELETKGGGTADTLTTLTLPTDHAYSDHRIALQSAVVDWLERLRTATPKQASRIRLVPKKNKPEIRN